MFNSLESVSKWTNSLQFEQNQKLIRDFKTLISLVIAVKKEYAD